MLEIQTIRNNPEWVKQRLSIKHFAKPEIIDHILALDEDRRKTQKNLEDILNKAKNIATQIGALYKQGNNTQADELKLQTSNLKTLETSLKEQLENIEKQQYQAMVLLPNLPNQNVPNGKTPEQNVCIKTNGSIPTLPPNALPHWELAQKYKLIDFELGNKITGAGFPVYTNKGAKLQRALINFFLDNATNAGYIEHQAPLLVNKESGFGTGNLPDKDAQMYHVTLDDYYLIPTAEVPLTNIYRDVILNSAQLPLKICGYTPCFRREAGSYGAHVRGLNRLHQFDKIEIVQIQHPDNSYQALNQMVAHVEGLLQQLQLPYRILALCGGDMSFASALTYDFEVWSAAQQRWLEVSSVSNFETFQSNRLKCRFKDASTGKTRLTHTLNGSALALPRIVASLLENNQTETGINIPDALHPYTGFKSI